MAADFLDSTIKDLLDDEIKIVSRSVACKKIEKQIVEEFANFKMKDKEIIKRPSGHYFHTEDVQPNIEEDNTTQMFYYYGLEMTNIEDIFHDCYIMKIFYEELIGSLVSFKFQILKSQLTVVVTVTWDSIFERIFPAYKGRIKIRKEMLLPEHIDLSSYVNGSVDEEEFMLFEFALHGEFYATKIYKQMTSQVKAYLMKKNPSLIEQVVFHNQDLMVKEYGRNYVNKIKEVFSNSAYEEEKKKMGIYSIECAERLENAVDSIIHSVEEKNCPSCFSSRTKFIRDSKRKLYLCFNCDDNFDIVDEEF